MKEKQKDKTHSITFLNCYGDLTVTWNERDAVKMEERIQKLLDQGLQFFIVKKRFLRPNMKVPIRKITDLEKNEITGSDANIAALFKDIDGTVCKDETESYDIVKGSNDPKEIVKGEVVCSKRPTAG